MNPHCRIRALLLSWEKIVAEPFVVFIPHRRRNVNRRGERPRSYSLFDEPTSSLDPERVREVLDVIRLLADKRHTMLIVTHELEFARQVSTRIAFMNEGRIAAIGAPEEIWSNDNPRLRRFLESMSKKG